jgi:hypothetical protein
MATAGAIIALWMQAGAVITDAAAMKPTMVIGLTAKGTAIITARGMAIIMAMATVGIPADMKGIPVGIPKSTANL